ncbi:MAG: Uma2 family endonuclease [Anaerolineae bacterium]|nr:Uma2 family endonuclease [Anaerolineae bacterium]NUQ04291.1 Uma2 family endonuclease [Anaerolineae bacterium]
MALPKISPALTPAEAAEPSQEVPPPASVRRVSVQEFLDMHERGVFTADDRLELLEGWIVEKMTKKPPRLSSADRLLYALLPRLQPGFLLRQESPVVMERSIPEPDFCILRGTLEDFAARLPTPSDVALVIEISDATLANDRTTKRRLYAAAGIPVYWLVKLTDRQIEVCTSPDPAHALYRQVTIFTPDAALPLVLDGQEIAQLRAADILP